jgi:hypothetical protein
MLVGCYSMDLYFENTEVHKYEYQPFPEEYTGRSRAACLRKARKDGWNINLKTAKCYCPECRRKISNAKTT